MKRACLLLALAVSLATAALTVVQLHDHIVGTETALREHAVSEAAPDQPVVEQRAEFGELAASPDTRRVADWIVSTRDQEGLPFLIIDKGAASIHVFDAGGTATAVAPVLLGSARGDHFAPGSAEKDMYDTAPAERITPAGRFVGQPGLNDLGHHVVWIQYEAGIAMHAVLNKRSRHHRLETPTPDDNRVSYGCVNLPREFYRTVVRPLFERSRAVVYVLPDNQDALELFASLRDGPTPTLLTKSP